MVVHSRRAAADYEVLEPVYSNKVEAQQMLETAIAKERERIFAQGKTQGEVEGWTKGKTQGEVEGWTKGKVEGQADLLISLLEKHFSPLTPAQKQHLYELDASQLLTLAEKLWHAQSLQDFWEEEKS